MDKLTATQIASKVIENATAFFKANKNFGAQTTMKKKTELKAQVEWLVSYCDRKSIDIQQFV